MTDKLVELIAKYFEKLNPNSNHIIATQLAGYLRNNGVTFSDAPVPMTNGDRIRAMSDEDLAMQFIYFRDDWSDYETPVGFFEDDEEAYIKTVEWLKQPSEVEHE